MNFSETGVEVFRRGVTGSARGVAGRCPVLSRVKMSVKKDKKEREKKENKNSFRKLLVNC